jgi:hypothetical protein
LMSNKFNNTIVGWASTPLMTLAHNAYSKEIQNEVCLGDLFL